MGLLDVLLEWREAAPVDEKEQSHNDGVYQYQHNRNPFIDHPEGVDMIFGDGLTDAPLDVPAAVAIAEVYPNPFNPSTQVVFSLAEPGPVRIEVYGLDGRRVRTLMSDTRTAGEHRVTWDGRSDRGQVVASGPYVVRLAGGGQVDSRLVTLLK